MKENVSGCFFLNTVYSCTHMATVYINGLNFFSYNYMYQKHSYITYKKDGKGMLINKSGLQNGCIHAILNLLLLKSRMKTKQQHTVLTEKVFLCQIFCTENCKQLTEILLHNIWILTKLRSKNVTKTAHLQFVTGIIGISRLCFRLALSLKIFGTASCTE